MQLQCATAKHQNQYSSYKLSCCSTVAGAEHAATCQQDDKIAGVACGEL
jgi:hypothetical protein